MNTPRIPVEQAPPRMAPLARLPLFFALEGKRVLLAGGSPAAAWKAELLSAAGANVDVIAPDICEDMLALSQRSPRGRIELKTRSWQPADLDNTCIAIGAFEGDDEAALFAAGARRRGIPVNVIDKPAYCDFAFGSIVNRSPLVIGISTDGAAPVFAQAIRARIEAMIPQGFMRWAEAAHRWRAGLKATGLSFAGRRRFWHLFTQHAVHHPNDEPRQDDFDALLATTRAEGESVEHGSVTLVGAGPGDPELLTLRAVRAMQSADVILFDDLVSGEVLDFARREAKKMLVGKSGHGPACKQSEINELMIALARAGKRVVRLKGGDPMIFGRAGEEIDACRNVGIAVEVVPGITAAQGAASRLCVSLTHRDVARRVQYVTGHGAGGGLPDDIDWKSLADPRATTIVYMPKKTLRELAGKAMAAGLDPATPALAVANATRSDQTIVKSSIGALSGALEQKPPSGPVLVMIGNALLACGAEPAHTFAPTSLPASLPAM
jgi:uroporphyrin-III C-methyltransferase/precorrin-2 dehydrogenase/sirohydrochlorin ferrochelatase